MLQGCFGADDEARTRYLHLGKVALYQMSYVRVSTLDIITNPKAFVNNQMKCSKFVNLYQLFSLYNKNNIYAGVFIMTDYTDSFSPEDIRAHKDISIFSYIGFLFIIPLFMKRNSPFARFHANQGLVLFILEICLSVVKRIVNFVFSISGLGFMNIPINFVFTIISILCLVLIVIGIMNLVNGRAKELPFIGKIRFIR